MSIIFIAIAPIFLILFYIYKRDKYEKEPMGLLLRSLGIGAVITIPIVIIELGIGKIASFEDKIADAFYQGFVVAAFTEEMFKFLAFLLIVWRNRNFNELFDGIIYAVFISLGFATVENILYVIGHGGGVGVLRAFTAVPAHALFGVTMGFYFGLARFNPEKFKKYLWLAILVPILLHGLYDFFLMAENGILLLLFIPFIVFLWIAGFKKIKKHSANSIFKDKKPEEIKIDLGEDNLN